MIGEGRVGHCGFGRRCALQWLGSWAVLDDLAWMRDHTSLLAWQAAHEASCRVFVLCRDHWVPWAAAAFSQLQHSALSAQLNIAEGYSFGRTLRGRNHLQIAYGSAVEAGDTCRTLAALDLVPGETLERIVEGNLRTQRLLLGLLRSRRFARQLSGAEYGRSPAGEER